MNRTEMLGAPALGRPNRGWLPIAALMALSLAAAVTPGVRGRLVTALSVAQQEPTLPGARFSDPPTDDEFLRAGLFAQPLVPVGHTNPEENTRLAALLVPYSQRLLQGERDAVQPLADFAAQHPHSPWTPGLELNVGAVYRQTGHFSKALATWQSAWDASKDLKSSGGRVVGDMAAAYLSQFEAYLGRKELLAPLLEELKTRPIRGAAAELVAESSRGMAEMESRPDLSFKCGPSALARILKHHPTENASASHRVLMAAKSTPDGLSLSNVQAISVEAGMSYQMAYRSPGAALLFPAVAHWKTGHYAALLGRDARSRLLVADATFGEDIAVTPSTFDEEASGYFLVPPGDLPEGWRPVDVDEGSTVWGRGNTGGNHDNGATGRPEVQAFPTCPAGKSDRGCSRWNVEASVVGLELRDDPVGYTPPFGPDMRFPMTYSHRDASQPATFTFTNFGNKWTFGWLSYVVDDSNDIFGGVIMGEENGNLIIGEPPGLLMSATVHRRDGGTEPYYFPGISTSGDAGVVMTNQTSGEGQFSQGYLTRNVDAAGYPVSYTRALPDGSVETFALAQGTPGISGQTFFLTELDDPQGNAVKINYDSQTRITSVIDATGEATGKTVICYIDSPAPCVPPDPSVAPLSKLQVTQIIDPFGRSAKFGYDPSPDPANPSTIPPISQLISITDVIGITSSYQYGTPAGSSPSFEDLDFINTLKTPFSTTTFQYTDSTNLNTAGSSRSVTATEVDTLANTPSRTSYVEFFQGDQPGGPDGTCLPIAPADITTTVPAGTLVDDNNIECVDGGVNTGHADIFGILGQVNFLLQYRNTFIWNPVQYADPSFTTSSKYLGAKVIHWLHDDDSDSNTNAASRIPESIKEPLETRVWFQYPSQGLNEFGSTVSVGATNQPTVIIRAVGDGTNFQLSQFQYDEFGHVTQSIDPVGRTLLMTYDPTNHIDLWSVTNITPAPNPSTPATNDVLLTLNYNPPVPTPISALVKHRPWSVTGANGQTTHLAYNAIGQLVTSLDPLGNSWNYNYTPTGITVPTACTGEVSCGFLTGIVGPAVPVVTSLGASSQQPTYAFTYDNVGRPFTAMGPDKQLLTFYYDNADRLIETVFPDESTESRGYMQWNHMMLDLTSFTDRMGYTTNRVYDGFRDLIIIDEPANRTTALNYWPDGTVQTIMDPLGRLTTYIRDVQGRANTIIYPDSSTQWYAYDLVGRVLAQSPNELVATPVAAIPAAVSIMPGTFEYAYNNDNTVATALLDWRAPTTFTYGDPGYKRVTGWSRIQGGTWAQPKCASGSSCLVLDQENYTYYPAGSLGANSVNQVLTTIGADPNGATGLTMVTSTYGYDRLNRVNSHQISIGPAGSIVNATESFEYDAIGRLTNDANLLDSFTYAYGDATARISGRTSAGGPQLAASYFPPTQDGLLQELSYTTPSGSALGQYSYGYDARHNVTMTHGPSLNDDASYTYDAYSQLLTATPTTSVPPTVTAVTGLTGNITSLETAMPGRLIAGRTYVPGASTVVDFGYDPANKMNKETTTSTTASSSSTAALAVSCDSALGSLDTIGSATTGQAFDYDNSNRLEGYWANASSYTSSGFRYDGLGRLSQVFDVVPATTGSFPTMPVANHSYVWCGQKMCVEVNNMQPVSAPDLGQPISLPDALYFAQGTVNNPATVAGASPIQRAYDVTDLLGSERGVVVDNAMTAEYEYDVFGNRTGSGTSNRGFAGLYYHAASGLQFAQNRVYDASLGRWLTRDPIGNGHAFKDPARFNATDLNLYAYVDNNPQSHVDPSGNDIWVEGPSGTEPLGHQSINIGDPFGDYQSYSFGAVLSLVPLHLGSVYEDTDPGGEIQMYLRTTPEQDTEALTELIRQAPGDSEEVYPFDATCRSYSQDYFKQFSYVFDVQPSTPPNRKPAPWLLGSWGWFDE